MLRGRIVAFLIGVLTALMLIAPEYGRATALSPDVGESQKRSNQLSLTTRDAVALAGPRGLMTSTNYDNQRATVIAQATDAAQAEKDEADRKKEAELEARFAKTCDPIRNRVQSLLKTAGISPGPFNKVFAELLKIKEQLPGNCLEEKVHIFGGSVEKVIPCYNRATYISLANGRAYVIVAPVENITTPTTTFNGLPRRKGEFVMGITKTYYYCIESVSPMIRVLPAMMVDSMARRRWDVGDRERLEADRAIALKKGDEEKISELTEKISKDPTDSKSYIDRGNAYQQKGEHERAIADFSQAITIKPDDADNWNHRCWGRAIAGIELKQALTDCERSLQLRPNDANTLDSRAFVYVKLGEYDRAIAGYTAALNVNATLATSRYGRGLAKLRKGDNKGGNADIAAAERINKNIGKDFEKWGIK